MQNSLVEHTEMNWMQKMHLVVDVNTQISLQTQIYTLFVARDVFSVSAFLDSIKHLRGSLSKSNVRFAFLGFRFSRIRHSTG